MQTIHKSTFTLNIIQKPARKLRTNYMQRCIADICEWMVTNALKLNEEKTEYIIFIRNKTPVHDAIKAGNNDAAAQDIVKILGVTLDRNMTLDRQVINTYKIIYMNIRKIVHVLYCIVLYYEALY